MPSLKPGRKTIIRFNRDSRAPASCRDVGELQLEMLPPKGQLFVVATGTDGRSETEEACKLAVSIIHDVYYSDPSQDISTSLLNAIRDANTVVHEMFNRNGSRHKLGINCSCMVVTRAQIHVAQVGQSSIYRVASHRIENLLDRPGGREPLASSGQRSHRFASRRKHGLALGLGVPVQVRIPPAVTLGPGERYLLCSDALRCVDLEMIRQIVLSGSPQDSCKWLTDFAHNSGIEQVDVRVIENVAVRAKRTKAAKIATSVAGWLLAILLVGLATFSAQAWRKDRRPVDGSVARFRQMSGFSAMFEQADSFFRAGAHEEAVEAYQRVLQNDPAHTPALDRISEIAGLFKGTADSYRSTADHVRASEYYKKVLELRPDDKDVRILLLQSQSQLQPPAKTEKKKLASEQEPRVPEAASGNETLPETVPQEKIRHRWRFAGLTNDDFRVDDNTVDFLRSSTPKKALYYKELSDFKLHLNLARIGNESPGRSGVILGYRRMSRSPYEKFYLLTAIRNNELLLQKCTSLKKTLIARIPIETADANGQLTIDVTCTANHIIIFSNDRRVYVLNENENIKGQIGLYADPNVHVQFSDMRVSKIPSIKNIVNPYSRN